MDLENGEPAKAADEPAQKGEAANRDDEAEEVAEGEEEEDAGDGEDEGPGEDLQDSSEEDEGDGNEYDTTDRFLVADDAAEDEDGEGGKEGAAKRRKKRRRRREEDEELDEEDYELIGQRPPRREERKRIRKLTQPAAGRQHISAEDIREELFGRDDGDDDLQDVDEEEAAAQRRAERRRREEDQVDDLDDDDEFADFLVDDDEGDKPDGEPRRRRRQALARALPAGVSADAFQEAQAIFGDADELLEQFRAATARSGQQPEASEEEGDDGLDEADLAADEDAQAERLRTTEEKRKDKEMKRITAKVEPEMLARAMLRGEDDTIRTTDLPERQQLQPSQDPREWRDPNSNVLAGCAQWIRERLLPPPMDERLLEDEDDDKARSLRHAQAQETRLLLTGFREVDGPSERSMDGRYEKDELMEEVRDLSRGQRAVRDGRRSTKAKAWREDPVEQDALLESIRAVVGEVFTKHNELPFLAMYRKQMLGDLLCGRVEDMPDVIKDESSRLPTGLGPGMVQAKHRRIRRWDVLWRVYDLAVQWRALAKRQEARQAGVEEAMDHPEATAADREMLDGLKEAFHNARTPEEIADVDAKFRQKQAESQGRLESVSLESISLGAGKRRPSRRSQYENLLKTGLEPAVRQIYITADAFGQNIDLNYRTTEVEDPAIEPRELAAQYINPEAGLNTPEDVLQRAQEMAICELLAQPQVRRAVRQTFLERALISTQPTPEGEQLLDPFHVYGRVKRIRGKPVQSFTGSDTFLRIAQAEKEHLIEVNIGMDETVLDEEIFWNQLDKYQSPNQNRVAQVWNAIRATTLKTALLEHLLPQLGGELRAKLLADAQQAVLGQVSDKLWEYASEAPTQVQSGDEQAVEARLFAAVCWGPGDPATTMVMLNRDGQLVDVLYAGQLSGAIRRTRRSAQGVEDIFSDPAKRKDAERVRDFLVQHTPHKIFLGGSCMRCVQLYEDLKQVLDHILDKMPSLFTRMETGYIELDWADESLAALWETSEAALQEMGDQLPLTRRAIALGRSKLEPLAVLAALCGPPAEILSMDLHPLKELLPRQALRTAAERICITAVNQVGLDLNVVAHMAWQAAPLQFVAGLGPRKAQLLARTAQREQFVHTRLFLFRELGILGKAVFRNCSGFLRITHSSEDANAEDLHTEDASRINPTQYELAKGLAKAILDVKGDYDPEDDLVLQVQARPNDIEGFNLQDFNRQLQDAGQNDQLTAMRDIAFELAAPAGELRRQRGSGSHKTTEVFYMLCGESEDSLKEGREVAAVVTFAGSHDVLVRLPDFGDAEGVITRVARDDNQGQLRDHFVRDQPIRVRVQSLVASASNSTISKLSVTLVDDSDQDAEAWERRYCQDIEPWYHILSRDEKARAAAEKRRAKAKKVISRPIRHPNFKNLSNLQAIAAMHDADVGACLFRPSEKGTDQITLTIKVSRRTDDGLGIDAYYNVECREGPKGSAVGAHLQLGKPLELSFMGAKAPGGAQQYEDLDEILARYAEPFGQHIKQIKGHRKYREGPWEHVKAQLMQEKQRMPGAGAAYVLGAKQETPGVFYIGFILAKTPRKEHMVVTGEGVYFRHESFKNIDHVLSAFKKKPYGDRVTAGEDAAPPPPPAQPARVSRFAPLPPAPGPGPPSGVPGPPPNPMQPIKPAWLSAPQQPQPQLPAWQQQQPPYPPQPPPLQQLPGSANGFPHNQPPLQQPVPGFQGQYGRR